MTSIIYYGFPVVSVALLFEIIFEIIFVHNRKAMYYALGCGIAAAFILMLVAGIPKVGNLSFMFMVFGLTLLVKLIWSYLKNK